MRARGRVERERRTEAEAASSGVSLTDGLLTTRDGGDLKAGDGEVPPHALVGFCRVYAGQLRTGQTLYALSPKYDPNLPATLQAQYITEVTVGRLYLLMGRELLPIETAYAGNTVGVAGLDNAVLKTATLCSVLPGPNLCSVLTGSAPIVRAALEPVHLADMPRLVRGLKLLNQSDPCVEVYVQETGEHVVAAAGELHLERCLADLRERYAGIEIHVSPPLVPFRETVAPQAHGPQAVTVTTTHRLCAITVSCQPLPPTVTKFLTDHKATIQQFWGGRGYAEASGDAVVDVLAGTGAPQARLGLVDFQQRLTDLFAEDERENRTHWGDVVPCLWLFGPKRIGPNMLLNKIPGHQVRPCYHHPSKQATRPESPAEPVAGVGPPTAVAADLLADKVAQLEVQDNDDTDRAGSDTLQRSTLADLRIRDLEEAIATGFQLATLNGPLCAEPVVGMCYIVEDCRLLTDRGDGPDLPLSTLLTTLPGQVIAATKEACRQTFLTWSPRLMLAMYDVDVQATAEVLGKVYAVLAKRRGRIVSEEMKDGTSLFQIRARLPVIESFGFADDIRKRTSGAASPQLVFSGFEALDEDPFWVPTTEEELEDLGEKADRENLAKKYVDGVRKRKGMFVEQKIVESAEKQRTLKK
ncbi:Cytoplasmic GTPase/eEF2-like protein (ribosomal biogenesis) [Tieghemiomyces parasiticus]|uniref:Elongation factor-like 1 n=1 Tax=Tieghemiomyces parasiticus TaxID=78921 RepID=A0A9W8DIW3_9FUNG|nr:Cytoplasmic GTPase/eEF2-like protein (ribosomal biogenesis) [Tieghemiomyces parasiticus]